MTGAPWLELVLAIVGLIIGWVSRTYLPPKPKE